MTINEMFLRIITNHHYRLDHYILINRLKELSQYSIEDAVEIHFNYIREMVTGRNWEGRKYEWCVSPTPKEAMALATMLEEHHRWEVI